MSDARAGVDVADIEPVLIVLTYSLLCTLWLLVYHPSLDHIGIETGALGKSRSEELLIT